MTADFFHLPNNRPKVESGNENSTPCLVSCNKSNLPVFEGAAEAAVYNGANSPTVPVETETVEQTQGRQTAVSDDSQGQGQLASELPRYYKNRYNFASFDCAASIIGHNAEARSATAILTENRDRYMNNVCGAAQRWVIVSLCDEILVDGIAIGAFEFFAGMPKDFRVSVRGLSKTVPSREGRGRDEWTVLGDFVADNSRKIQVSTKLVGTD